MRSVLLSSLHMYLATQLHMPRASLSIGVFHWVNSGWWLVLVAQAL